MRAIVVDQPGGTERLRLAEVADPVPANGEVAIDVSACALNRADLLQRRGLYPPPPGASEILGLECAGVIASLGAGTSRSRIGERVMALLAGGGYAERVVVDERLTLPVPANLSLLEGAAVPEAFLTAHEALLSVGRLEPGETLLVHAAASGVGSAAVQLGRCLGARVIATAGSAEKCELARTLGADHTIDRQREDFAARVLELSDGRGADVIVDFVGAAYSEAHARCLATAGRQVVVGLLGGAKATIDLSRLLAKRQSIAGLVMRTRSLGDKAAIVQAFRRRFLPLFESGRLRPVIDSVFALADVRRAHERMEQNLNLGKIVLEVRAPASAGG